MSPASSKETSWALNICVCVCVCVCVYIYIYIYSIYMHCCRANLHHPLSEVSFSFKGSSPSFHLSRSTEHSSDSSPSLISSVTSSLQIPMVCPVSGALLDCIPEPGVVIDDGQFDLHARTTSIVFHIADILMSFVFQPVLPHSGIYVGVDSVGF
jgi:hypothetical protein